MVSLSIYRASSLALGLSLVFHMMLAATIHTASGFQNAEKQKRRPGTVQVKVKPKDEPKPILPPKPPEVVPKVRPKPPQPMANTTKKSSPPKADTTPIQGLSKESLANDGKGGFTAPVGNTLMVPDEGRRVTEAAPLEADLSSDPKLLAETVVVPSYTDAALDAAFEGRITIEVFVDVSGNVIQADPLKKIGYGMDERILRSALSAKFLPRRNRYGQPEPGWAKITFNLQVP